MISTNKYTVAFLLCLTLINISNAKLEVSNFA